LRIFKDFITFFWIPLILNLLLNGTFCFLFLQEQGELEFRRGDVITVTDKADQHWWTGELGNRRGLFPATYVTPYRT
jgi:hypothetical protein